MGYLTGSLGGDHTSFWCDHDGCSCGAGESGRLQRDGTHSPVYSIDWLHSRGWELVDSDLYCPAHITAGIQKFAANKRHYYIWEAERDGRKLIESEVLRVGTVSEETKAKVRDLLQRAERRAQRDIRDEEERRLGRHTRRAAKAEAAAIASAVLEALRG
mgnify:CR=1 FL=1